MPPDIDHLADATNNLNTAANELRNGAIAIVAKGGDVGVAQQILNLVGDTEQKVKQIEQIQKRLAEPKK